MNYKKVGSGYLLRFELHDSLISGLESFVRTQKIKGAWLQGLGAARGVELGFYNLESENYEWHSLTELMEITNLTGNVSWMGEEPVIHVHATLSNKRLQAIGGHVKELIVGGTCEVFLRLLDDKITRSFDHQTGLNLLHI